MGKGPFKDWSQSEVALLSLALLATGADVESQKKLQKEEGGREMNPLLGSKPSNAKLNAAGVLAGAAGTALASWLGKDYRKAFLAGWAGFESTAAWQNNKGVGFESFAHGAMLPTAIGVLSAVAAKELMNDDNASLTVAPNAITYTKKF